MLQSMGLQRVGHDLATEQQLSALIVYSLLLEGSIPWQGDAAIHLPIHLLRSAIYKVCYLIDKAAMNVSISPHLFTL